MGTKCLFRFDWFYDHCHPCGGTPRFSCLAGIMSVHRHELNYPNVWPIAIKSDTEHNYNNNNNNTSICKAHNVSIRAESEAPVYVDDSTHLTGSTTAWVNRYQNVAILDLLKLRMTEVVETTAAIGMQSSSQIFTDKPTPAFYKPDTLLLPNQWCQSTEGTIIRNS